MLKTLVTQKEKKITTTFPPFDQTRRPTTHANFPSSREAAGEEDTQVGVGAYGGAGDRNHAPLLRFTLHRRFALKQFAYNYSLS